MDYGWEFLWSVIASSAGTAILLGALGWVCRGQISHWLNKDLEAVKAKYQRDLEDYRTSLIAATEQTKARQALKTAGALKIIERKFLTVEALARVLRDHASGILSASTIDFQDVESRRDAYLLVQTRVDQVASRLEDAAAFLADSEYVDVLDLNKQVLAIAKPLVASGWQISIPPDDAAFRSLLLAQSKVNGFLRKKIVAMMEME